MDTASAADNKIDPGARPDIRPRSKGALRVMESKGRILVVDDEVNARTALLELLRDEGYAVETAADGFKALGKMEEFAPDLVLTDLKMPGMDGIQLLGKIRESDADLPVVVMTAFGEVETAVGAMRAGARDYLSKPVNVGELSVVVEREMAAASAPRRGGPAAGAPVREIQLRQHHRQLGADAGRCSRPSPRSRRRAPACSSPASRAPARS